LIESAGVRLAGGNRGRTDGEVIATNKFDRESVWRSTCGGRSARWPSGDVAQISGYWSIDTNKRKLGKRPQGREKRVAPSGTSSHWSDRL
jgi:hypothetical protein